MRTALAVLIAAAGFTLAHAQEAPAAPPAAALAQQPDAPPPAPSATAPTAPAAPQTSAPQTSTPGATPQAPGPTAAPAPAAQAAPAAPAPTLPTTGDGAAVLSVLEQICVPAVRGQALDQLARSAGFKNNKRDGTWTKPLGADRAYTITLLSQGANKDVCQAEIHFAVGQEAPIVSALNVWSFLHQPELILQANYVAVDADGVQRVRKSWENLEAHSSTAVNFTTERKPDGSPLNPRYDLGKLYYQERKF
jgi:hypothetical protein